MFKELDQAEINNLLETSKNIAVVGISSDPGKISRRIAEYLVNNNYRVAGVNPAAPLIPGITVYKSLLDIPYKIDIVNVFRKSETINELVSDIIKIRPVCMWLQLDIVNDSAAEEVFNNSISIVQDKCILVCHKQWQSNT
jgi:uncharacterized protein